MKKNIIGFALLLISFLAQAQKKYDFSKVAKILQDSVSRYAPGNGATLIINHKGTEVYNQSLGAWTENRQMPIASASKWLSAATIAVLVDEGKLAWNDSIGKYLPVFTKYKKGAITIRQCFSHTAGFRGNSLYHDDKNLTLTAAVDSIARRTALIYTPGKGFVYGGVSMHIVGRIAEVVTGQTWEQVFATRIAMPLGMQKTDYKGFGVNENPQIAGGARSTPREYNTFVQMISNAGKYNGKQIVSAANVAEILKDQTNNAPIFFTPYTAVKNYDATLVQNRYGLGCWIEKKNANETVAEWGSQGAFGWSPWIDPARGISGVFGVYSDYKSIMGTYLQIKKLTAQAIDTYLSTHEKGLADEIKIYPNPAQHILVIESAHEVTQIRLTTLDGRSVLFDVSQNAINISDLESGIYLMQCFNRQREIIAHKRFIKQ